MQLPLEILDQLLVMNTDPVQLSTSTHFHALPSPPAPSLTSSLSKSSRLSRPRLSAFGEPTPPASPPPGWASLTTAPDDVQLPPAIDPGIFRSVTSIRRLVDEAAELAVRAASGVSAAQLRAAGSAGWDAHAYGGAGEGRPQAMSAQRVHRLRVLAVQKLAQAYKADEVAASVMVMQGGNVFDDIAERVLRHGMFFLVRVRVEFG